MDTLSRRTLLAAAALLPLMAIAPLAASAAAPPSAQSAVTLVKSLTDEAIAVLRDRSQPRSRQIDTFRRLFNGYFAVDDIGRFVLGRHARQASPQEMADYRRLFEDLIVYGYAKRFASYAGESLVVRSTQPGDDGATVVVMSDVASADAGTRIPVDWLVANVGGAPRIVDVKVEGVSLRLTQRSDFSAAIKERGGTVAGLLDVLRQKVATLQAELERPG